MGIISIKTERTHNQFLSDVLVAVASLDLKVPVSVAEPRTFLPAAKSEEKRMFSQAKETAALHN